MQTLPMLAANNTRSGSYLITRDRLDAAFQEILPRMGTGAPFQCRREAVRGAVRRDGGAGVGAGRMRGLGATCPAGSPARLSNAPSPARRRL